MIVNVDNSVPLRNFNAITVTSVKPSYTYGISLNLNPYATSFKIATIKFRTIKIVLNADFFTEHYLAFRTARPIIKHS